MRWAWIAAVPAVLANAVAVAQEPPVVSPPAPSAQAAAPTATQLSAAQLETALKALRTADLHGLRPKDYLPADEADAAAVTQGLLRYARDVKVGRLALGDFPELWAVRPPPYDPAPELAKAVAEDRLQPWLDGLAPRYAGYVALKRGLVRYREIATAGGWETIPPGAAMGFGSTDPRVPALRKRLAVEDPQAEATGSPTFDKALQDAVVRAQKRYGLKPDGVVGNGTLAYLNQPVGQRVLQIIANMERWRWLPATMPSTRVQVNSGAAIVTLFRDDKPVLSMKAVSGKPGDETPMLMSAIHSVVINPPWNVPSRIAREELWPKERARPGYLASHNYRIIPVEGGEPRLQQKSGDSSALGRFKFDFDNPFAVYLHDTPSKGGFDLYARQASHGCVRIEKPRALAEALLAADPAWAYSAAFDTALGDGSKTQRVKLPEQVPVMILYWTAFAGADGLMHFRGDPYNWDRLLLTKVGVVGQAQAKA
ncbi:L,D-transpeptidase family protein [Phenylobacterium sp. J426]|uniref:L,D-transpeptidase family protein n=1 Tax=Phenylobacterium sp. J426 TaxID=2898439 RepID=UPI0021510B71|nr:L,D-transpeptidase family protein [Phenylobacterium sp. J426]MCR5872935.1 L,D-transpeptidase family protein [Phenylobacterium sp. J426]